MSSTNRPTCILIVDDEPLIRPLVTNLLQDHGIMTLEASNGVEALAALADHPEISVLLTDISMPSVPDGLGLVREVRKHWSSVRIILPSGLPMSAERAMADYCSFIGKRYTVDELLAAVR